ncbi:hypothetical protein V5P93_004964 [Actinokineospora auranticolor]|uniref:Uncharacterized protein n=1 Tax=Actinokineospora auranticolor TaxID=155976 RepID=A0A2S6GBF5_9PSEU|nr:hypothetical protein [Actinokineospora auranticolor]PPK61224.1 hypothetical protein CLV40_14320 [Actinokineospora auranticolor]
MSTETVRNDTGSTPTLPTAPCSVVWSQGHAFVLEYTGGGAHWVGFDAFGRPRSMTPAALERQGWSTHRLAS